MGTGIFGFIYETMRKRVNDTGNTTYWLPKVLQGIDGSGGHGKLLPVEGSDWQLGSAPAMSKQASQTLMSSWWQSVTKEGAENHQPMIPPGADPELVFDTVAIQGLSNVYAQEIAPENITQPGDGYVAVVPLLFGYYPSTTAVQAGMRELGPVSFGGTIPAAGKTPEFKSTFTLSQAVCSAPKGAVDPTECDGFISATIVGKGTFKILAQGDSPLKSLGEAEGAPFLINATTVIELSGTGKDRLPVAQVQKLEFPGKLKLTLSDLTIDAQTEQDKWLAKNVWEPSAKQAFADPTTQAAMVSALEDQLNTQSNLGQLNTMLTSQLRRALDGAFGSVPAGELPTATGPQAKNPVDEYLFDRVRLAVNNPQSQFYLPSQILKFQNPTLEPYEVDKVNVGNVDGGQFSLQDVTLIGVTVTGLSNIESPADKMVFNPNAVLDSTLDLSLLARPPAPTGVPLGALTATGKFTFVSQGSTGPEADFSLTVKQSSLSSQLRGDGEKLEDLVLTFLAVTLGTPAIPPGQKPNYWASIKITNAGGMGQILTDIINNTDGAIASVLQGLNDAAKSHLGDISKYATTEVQNLIKSKLGS